MDNKIEDIAVEYVVADDFPQFYRSVRTCLDEIQQLLARIGQRVCRQGGVLVKLPDFLLAKQHSNGLVINIQDSLQSNAMEPERQRKFSVKSHRWRWRHSHVVRKLFAQMLSYLQGYRANLNKHYFMSSMHVS